MADEAGEDSAGGRTVFRFLVSRQVAEALGPLAVPQITGQQMTVKWGDSEARARIAQIEMGDHEIAVTMVIQERLPMGAELGRLQVTDE